MRKILKLIVVFVSMILALGFIGCSVSEDTTISSNSTTEQGELHTVIWKNSDGTILETDLEVLEGTLPSYDGETPVKEGGTFTGWTPEVSSVEEDVTYTALFSMSYVISSEVIVSNDDVVFTITKVEDGFLGPKIYVNFENKTTDKELMFAWDNISVNGYMVGALFATTVSAGKMANDTISVYDLEDMNIQSIDELEFNLRIYDSNDWSADYIINDFYTVYPTGFSSDTIIYPERLTSTTEEVILDDENSSFIILSSEFTSTGGYELEYYIENKTTDKELMFSWDDVSMNGYMIDPFFASSITPGKREYGTITFSSWRLEELGFESIDEIEFNLRVYDENDWLADNLVDDIYAVYPTGKTPDSVIYPNRVTTATEVIIYENNQCSFIILSSEINTYGEYEISYFIENKTDDLDLMFTWNDVSVNGYMIDPYFASLVIAGKREYGTITFYSSDLEENSITEVNNIEFELEIYNDFDWLEDPILQSVFTYTPVV